VNKIVIKPHYLENMGPRIVGYILNINESLVCKVISQDYQLDANQKIILNDFLVLCEDRYRENYNFKTFYVLSKTMQDHRFLFNKWHEDSGGEKFNYTDESSVFSIALKIVLELYPLYLSVRGGNFKSYTNDLIGLVYKSKDFVKLIEAIDGDKCLSKLFNCMDERNNKECVYSSPYHGSDRLSMKEVATCLIFNSLFLAKIRCDFTRKGCFSAVTDIISMLEDISEGKKVKFPIYLGFDNVVFDDFTSHSFHGFKLQSYNDDLRSVMLGSSFFSNSFYCCYEYSCEYNLIFPSSQDSNSSCGGEGLYEEIDSIKENLSLSFSLSAEREVPVGLLFSWELFFNPLSRFRKINMKTIHPDHHKSIMPRCMFKKDEISRLEYWFDTLSKGDDKKIRLAIRRILSSMNERVNPVDGFIDIVIAWENLFGSKFEISYRISVAMSKLLSDNQADRLVLCKKISKYYNERSKIIHGVKEVTFEDAIIKRDECLIISFESLRELYKNHYALLSDDERSKKIALL